MKTKRLTALVLVVCMLLTIMPTAFAASVNDFTDFPTGWSRAAMEAAVNNGLLIGVSSNEIKPMDNLTRAEMAAIVVRAFGAETKSDISAFKDVKTSDWFYDYVAKAVKMEAFNGKSSTEMAPLEPITREEVFVALARIMVLESTDTVVLNKFKDKDDISSWAIPAITALVKKGYLNGDEQGNLNPKANITREEFAQFMHNMIKVYITEPGTYTQDLNGTTVLRVGNVTLKGMTNINDLVAGDGAGTGSVVLENVKIRGRLLTRGGDFTLKDTTVSENVVVKNVNGVTNFNNYEDETVFEGINKVTEAKFLEKKTTISGGSSGSRPSTTVRVVFNLPDGTQYVVKNPSKNSTFASFKPADPTREGYTFDGWYLDDERITDDMKFTAGGTLTARFSAIKYTITYVPGDFALTGTATTEYTIEKQVKLPVEADFAAHDGWLFDGWYKDAAFTGESVTEIPIGSTGNLTFYAKWTKQAPNTAKITFNMPDGTTVVKTPVKGTLFGAMDKPADPAKEGYTFDGWYADNTKITDDTVLDADMVLTPRFTVISYTIAYTSEIAFAGAVQETYTVENAITLPVEADFAAHEGWIFKGWYKDAEFTGEPVTAIEKGTTGNIALYAKWEKVEYTITYNSQFGFITAATDKYTVTDTVALPVEADFAPHSGWIFGGWYKDAEFTGEPVTELAAGTTGDVTFYAKWTEKPAEEVTVTFVMPDGTTDVQQVVKGTLFGAVEKPADPTKEGYTFDGWYADDQMVTDDTALNADIVLMPKFTAIEYTITYVSSVPFGGTVQETYTVEDLVTLPIEAAFDEHAGLVFEGWYKDEAYTDGPVTEIAEGTTGDITFYAKWTEEKSVFTVTFKLKADDTDAYATVEVEQDTAIGAGNMPQDPIVGTNKFIGWADEQGNAFDENTIVTGNMTVIAQWQMVLVRFFEGFTTDEAFKKGEVVLNYGSTVPSDQIPSSTDYVNGYKKGPALADCYETDYTHQIAYQYWYKDEATGKWKIFNDSVVITKDTDVFNMIKRFGVFVNNPALPSAVAVSAAYQPDDTRTLDSLKDMAVSGRNQLETVMSFPQYDKLEEKVINKLVSTGVITENREIKITNVPVAITSVISPEKIRLEIKSYITSMIENPERLDAIFTMIDVQDFINQIGAENLIDMLTDAQILHMMKDPANEERVVSFIKESLNNPAMNKTIAEYLKTLISTDPAVKAELIAGLKEQLKTDAALRNTILNDAQLLEAILSQPAWKDSIVDLIITDEFIDSVFADEALKETLVKEFVKDSAFISILINTTEFEDYLIYQIKGNALGASIKTLLNENPSFREAILEELKQNAEFMALINGDMRNEVLAAMDGYAPKDDVLDYIFGRGDKDYSAFISETDIEALYKMNIPGYDLMTEAQRAAAIAALAENEEVRAEIWDTILPDVEAYKEKVIDDFANGMLDNAELEDLIDEVLIQNIIKFIDDEPITAEAEIREAIIHYVRTELIDVDAITDADIKAIVEQARDGFINTAKDLPNIVDCVKEFRDTNEVDAKTVVLNNYETLADYIKNNASDPAVHDGLDGLLMNYADRVDDAVISDLIDQLLANPDDTTIIDYLSGYVQNPANEAQIERYIKNFIASDSLNEEFVHTYRADIAKILSNADISEIVDEQMIKDYINGLTPAEKSELADKVYENLETLVYYKEFISCFDNNKDSFEINENNTMFVMGVAEAIKAFSYEEIIGMVDNAAVDKILEIMGDDFLKRFFEQAQTDYYNGIVAIVDEIKADVEAGNPAKTYQYSTALTFRVNLVTDVLIPAYDKAQEKLIEKLENNNVYYNENPYLKYLVNQDVVAELVEATGTGETEDLTGYKVKNELEYYDYAVKMLIIADDALCWYGDELTEEQFDALYEAVLTKAIYVHDKFNEILAEYDATGKLPEQIEKIINSVSQINSLITKYQPQIDAVVDRYLGSGLNKHFESTDIMNNDKVQTAIDILFGMDDPVFTIDMLYDIFYRYDDTMQEKLKELIESGKLKKAIDKFEALDFVQLLKGKVDNEKVTSLAEKLNEIKNSGRVRSAFASIYDVLVIVADYGIEPFRIEQDVETTEDAYQINLGNTSIKVKRYFE